MVTKTRGFTLVEMIMVIVIMGILSAGTFVSLKHLYQRVAKTKALSELSFDSQIIADQIATLMYDRVPSMIYGYDPDNPITKGNRKYLYDIVDNNTSIVEWYGTASEHLKEGNYTGFVDMDASDGNRTIKSHGINLTKDKFGNDYTKSAIIFAGSFDSGDATEYNITAINNTSITLETKPKEIYEKYYLVDSAYTIARKANITTTCSDINLSDENNTLYLFYNYRPWKGKNFCDGNVTILTKEARGFEVGIINDSIYFNLTLSRHIRGVDTNVTISKQKVVF